MSYGPAPPAGGPASGHGALPGNPHRTAAATRSPAFRCVRWCPRCPVLSLKSVGGAVPLLPW